MTINLKILCKIGITLLLLHTFFLSIITSLLSGSNIVLLIGLLFALSVIAFNHIKIKCNIYTLCFLIILMFVFYGFVKNNSLSYITFLAIAIIAVFLKMDEDLAVPKIIMICSGIHAFATIFFFFNTSAYYKLVYPILSLNASNLSYKSALTSHYSMNGIYLAIGVITFFAFYISGKKKIYLIGLLLTSLGLLLTTKRAHFLFSIMAILFVYYINNLDMNILNKYFKMLILIGVSIILFFILAEYIPEVKQVIERFIVDNDDDITSGRIEMYEAAWDMFINKPIFGIGWKEFIQVSQPLYNIRLGKSPVDVHNVYLQLLAETGVVGFISFMTLFIKMYVDTTRTLIIGIKNQLLTTDKMKAALNFSLIMQTFFLLYCITGNPLYDIQCYLPYFLACSIGYNVRSKLIKDYGVSILTNKRIRI